jgi:hypothetical protein
MGQPISSGTGWAAQYSDSKINYHLNAIIENRPLWGYKYYSGKFKRLDVGKPGQFSKEWYCRNRIGALIFPFRLSD